MKIKKGVSVQGLKPEILLAIQIADWLWSEYLQELVVTSGTDGKHSAKSRHYIGLAVDLRSRYFTASEKRNVLQQLKDRLGFEYQVVSHKTHIHVQYNGAAR